MSGVERVSPHKLKLALLSARSHRSSDESASPRRRAPMPMMMPKSGGGGGGKVSSSSSSATTVRTPRCFNSRSTNTSGASPPPPRRSSRRRQHHHASSPPACLELLPLAGMLRLKLTRAQQQQPLPKSLSSARYHHALDATTSAYLNDLSVIAEACRRGERPQAESRATLASATTYEHLGLWEKAIEHFTRYLAVSEDLGDVEAQSLALNRIGICRLKADHSAIATAARCHRAQLKLAPRGGSGSGGGYARFVAYTNLGMLYQEKYADKKGRELDRVEKEKKHKLRFTRHAATLVDAAAAGRNSYSSSSSSSSSSNDAADDAAASLRKALVCHQKALDAALEDFSRESETIAVSNLAVVNFQLEDWAAALGLAERCMKLTRHLQNVMYRLRSMHNVAVASHILSVHHHTTPPPVPSPEGEAASSSSSGAACEAATSSKRALTERARALFLEAGRLAQEAANGVDISAALDQSSGGGGNSGVASTDTAAAPVSHAAAAQLEELAARCRNSVAITAVAPLDVDARLAELIGSGVDSC